MPTPRQVPARGSYFLDARGDGRALRVSWHLDPDGVGGVGEVGGVGGVVVLSLWRDNVCTGSFRLGLDDVPDLLRVLNTGVGAALAMSRPGPHGEQPAETG